MRQAHPASMTIPEAIDELIGQGVFNTIEQARDFASRADDDLNGHHCDLNGREARAVATLILALREQ